MHARTWPRMFQGVGAPRRPSTSALEILRPVAPDRSFNEICLIRSVRESHSPNDILTVTPAVLGSATRPTRVLRSEEHTSELQSLMRISYAVFCLKKKTKHI